MSLLSSQGKSNFHLNFLVAASHTFNETSTCPAICRELLRMCVPFLGDACAICIPTAKIARQLGLAHIPAHEVDLLAKLSQQCSLRQQASQPREIHEPLFYGSAANGEANSEVFDDTCAALVQQFPSRSHLMVLPLRTRGRSYGALALVGRKADHSLKNDDVALAQELAHRVAIALERLQLLQEVEQARLETLEARSELARYSQRARNAAAVRDEFLCIASHELRTPLTTLGLQLGHMERLLGKRNAQTHGARFVSKLGRANRQASRLARLVDNLLDVTRISAGDLCLECKNYDLGRLLTELCERWDTAANQAGCALETEIVGPLWVNCDCKRLEQVFGNLLENALKYGAGHPIELTARQHDDAVLVTIRDLGVGIADEAHQRIFERFERASSSHQFGGLGLGLFIARRIVEAHGGSIFVNSHVGHGAAFTVALPEVASNRQGTMLDTTNQPPCLRLESILSCEPNRSKEAVWDQSVDSGAHRL